MRTLSYLVAFLAIIFALPLSWWLIERSWRDPQSRLGEQNRASVDRNMAGTGFNMPAGGGDS